jgi:hypothetical protein
VPTTIWLVKSDIRLPSILAATLAVLLVYRMIKRLAQARSSSAARGSFGRLARCTKRQRATQLARKAPILRTYIICLNVAPLLRFGLAPAVTASMFAAN